MGYIQASVARLCYTVNIITTYGPNSQFTVSVNLPNNDLNHFTPAVHTDVVLMGTFKPAPSYSAA